MISSPSTLRFFQALAVSIFSVANAQAAAPPSGQEAVVCETVQSDRLLAGGPLRQAFEIDLLRCGTEYRMDLIEIADGRRQSVYSQNAGPVAAGALVELAGGACRLAGKPILENLAIHGRWGKRKSIRFGAGLLGAWLPDANARTIRAITPKEKLECFKDEP